MYCGCPVSKEIFELEINQLKLRVYDLEGQQTGIDVQQDLANLRDMINQLDETSDLTPIADRLTTLETKYANVVNQMEGWSQYVDDALVSYATKTDLANTDAQNDADLDQHKQDDTVKYSAMYNNLNDQTADLRTQLLNLQASISNKTLSTTTEDITNTTYTVSSSLGGRITGQGIRNVNLLGITLLSTGTVDVNGNEVYNNTSLLGIGNAPVLVWDVQNGDTITSNGMESLVFQAYVGG